ncbi:hypothetical protein EJ05DRAFT_426235, partial [Pseudovirgaria hyperparasitica]
HSWTDDELNLISYLRLYHNWPWIRIQKTYLPSMTKSAISNAYTRTSDEDRVYRASIVASLTKSTSTTSSTLDNTYQQFLTRASFSRRLPGPSSRSTRNLAPQPRRRAAIISSSSSSSAEETQTTSHNVTTRYNLRPNRSRSFQRTGEPLDQVDQIRFPHCARTCRNLSRLHTVLDEDYVPPSHSPTPDLSDRSPSNLSSAPGSISSLELFGLEVRPADSPER